MEIFFPEDPAQKASQKSLAQVMLQEGIDAETVSAFLEEKRFDVMSEKTLMSLRASHDLRGKAAANASVNDVLLASIRRLAEHPSAAQALWQWTYLRALARSDPAENLAVAVLCFLQHFSAEDAALRAHVLQTECKLQEEFVRDLMNFATTNHGDCSLKPLLSSDEATARKLLLAECRIRRQLGGSLHASTPRAIALFETVSCMEAVFESILEKFAFELARDVGIDWISSWKSLCAMDVARRALSSEHDEQTVSVIWSVVRRSLSAMLEQISLPSSSTLSPLDRALSASWMGESVFADVTMIADTLSTPECVSKTCLVSPEKNRELLLTSKQLCVYDAESLTTLAARITRVREKMNLAATNISAASEDVKFDFLNHLLDDVIAWAVNCELTGSVKRLVSGLHPLALQHELAGVDSGKSSLRLAGLFLQHALRSPDLLKLADAEAECYGASVISPGWVFRLLSEGVAAPAHLGCALQQFERLRSFQSLTVTRLIKESDILMKSAHKFNPHSLSNQASGAENLASFWREYQQRSQRIG